MSLNPHANDYFLQLIIFAVAMGLAKCMEGDILQCYKCSVTVEKYSVGNTTITTPLCSKFKESALFVVECPYSTMCLKTISVLHIQTRQKKETVTRGCAQQKNTTQIFRNKHWEQEHVVQEVYEEGCTEIQDNNLAGLKNIHCYCRGALCNFSNLYRFNVKLLSLTILLHSRTLFDFTLS